MWIVGLPDPVQGRGRPRLLYDRQHGSGPGRQPDAKWENPAASKIRPEAAGTEAAVRRLLTFTIC